MPNYAETGTRPVDGQTFNGLINMQGHPTNNGITALAGGANSAATPVLAPGLNRITVCATNGDSVILPTAAAGTFCMVVNSGAATLKMFAQTSDTINTTAGATGLSSLTTGLCALYFAPVNNKWFQLLSA